MTPCLNIRSVTDRYHKVGTNRSAPASLDGRVRYSSEVQKNVIQLLEELIEAAKSGTHPGVRTWTHDGIY